MIIITGGSGGLGRCLVKELSAEHEIVATYHKHRPEAVDLPGLQYAQLDVTNSDEVLRFVAAHKERLRKVVVINAAGISLDGMAHKLSESSWDTVIDTNLKGAFNLARAVLPIMREDGWGRIINISSVVGQIGVPGTSAYAASKAGLFGLTRALAAEGASKNVTVNTLALGYFDAGMIHTIPAEQLAKIVQTIPMKRLGDPADLVRAVRFLIDAGYVTGTTININGGLIGG